MRLCEATTTAADRAEGTALGATEYATDASPWPPWSPGIEIHAASVVIDQVQSRAVVMVNEPEPPVEVNVDGALLAVTWHLLSVGALTEVCAELQAGARQASASADVEANAPSREPMSFLPGVQPSQAPRQIRVGTDNSL
jgi:hypothetical protein